MKKYRLIDSPQATREPSNLLYLVQKDIENNSIMEPYWLGLVK